METVIVTTESAIEKIMKRVLDKKLPKPPESLLKELVKGERSENGFIDRIFLVFPPNLKKEYRNELELSTDIVRISL